MLPALGADGMEKVLDVMPAFPERESLLEQLLKRSKEEATDQDEWSKSAKGASHDTDDTDTAGSAAAGGGTEEATDPPADEGDTDGMEAEEEEDDDEEEDEDEDEDLLGGGDGAAAGGGGDPSGFDDDSAGAAEEIRMTPEQQAESVSNFASLMTKGKGVLFQDSSVQIGVQVAIEEGAGEGILRVFLGNKSDEDLTNLIVQADGMPELEVGAVTGFPGAVAARKQARGEVTVRCLGSYQSTGKLRVSFRSSGGSKHHAYPLPLPVVASHFCKPLSMDMPTYKKRWPVFTGDKAEQASIAAPGGNAEAAAAACEGLHMAVIAKVPAAVAAACTMRTDKDGEGGRKLAVGALVRVMIKESGYSVEVRAQDGKLSKALVKILGLQLR